MEGYWCEGPQILRGHERRTDKRLKDVDLTIEKGEFVAIISNWAIHIVI